MWEISSNSQAFSAVVAMALGVVLCICYDLVRAFRDYKRTKSTIVFLMDIFIFAFSAVATFVFLQLFTNGRPRLYVFIFIGIGFLFCRISVSYYLVKCVKFCLRKLAKLTCFASNNVLRFARFIEKIFVDVKNFIKKLSKGIKKSKKVLKNNKGMVYNTDE